MLVWQEEELLSAGHEQADEAHQEVEVFKGDRRTNDGLGQIDMAFREKPCVFC